MKRELRREMEGERERNLTWIKIGGMRMGGRKC